MGVDLCDPFTGRQWSRQIPWRRLGRCEVYNMRAAATMTGAAETVGGKQRKRQHVLDAFHSFWCKVEMDVDLAGISRNHKAMGNVALDIACGKRLYELVIHSNFS